MALADLLPYPPDVDHALEDLFEPVTMADPGDISDHEEGFTSAKYLFKPHSDELLALIAGRVSSKQYAQEFTCDASDAVGNAVRLDTATKVIKALATSAANAAVIGFIRSKRDDTHCRLSHFYIVSGLSGLTVGNAVYLKNDGTFGPTAGTYAYKLGRAISTTAAILFASPQPIDPRYEPDGATIDLGGAGGTLRSIVAVPAQRVLASGRVTLGTGGNATVDTGVATNISTQIVLVSYDTSANALSSPYGWLNAKRVASSNNITIQSSDSGDRNDVAWVVMTKTV